MKRRRIITSLLLSAIACIMCGTGVACGSSDNNGANEVAVAAFLDHKCGYLDIVGSIEYALGKAQFVKTPTLEDYAAADAESRALAREYLKL